MSVTKRKDGGWMCYVTFEGRRVRKTFKSEAEARTFEAKLRLGILAGEGVNTVSDPQAQGKTIAEVGELVRSIYWDEAKASSDLIRNWRDTVDFFGRNTPVNAISGESVKKFIDHCYTIKGFKPATVNRKLAALSRVLRYSWKNGLISFIPTIPRQRENNTREFYFKPSEVEQILKYFSTTRNFEMADLCVVLVETGMRLSEALGLRGVDVQDSSALLADTKSGRAHRVHFPSRSLDVVQRRKATLAEPFDLLFTISKDNATKTFTKVKRKFNFPEDACLHSFRHTFASWLVSSGVPIEVVSKKLNHSRLETTMRYAKFAPVQDRKVDGVFERLSKVGDEALLSPAN